MATFNIITKTANYTITNSDDTILCDATSGNIIITLPTVSSALGMKFSIIKINSANTVTVKGNGAELIDGSKNFVINNQWGSMAVISNGAMWYALYYSSGIIPSSDPTPDPNADYYVSTSGSDSNVGTILKPWRTIQKAANTVQPGKVVCIRGGIYKERVNLKTSGSENNYITFMNYPGEVVTIDGTGIDWGYNWDCLFDLESKHYIKLKGLRVINSRWFGIGSTPDSNGCQHVIIQNCSTFNTQGSGITFLKGSNITIDGNSVERACTGADNTQECISLNNTSNFEIKNNHVFNRTTGGIGGEGIDAKQGSSNGKIYNNTVHDLDKVGLYVDAFSKHQYNIEVYGNRVYNCPVGIAVATEAGGLLENVQIYNNLVYNCSTWGLIIGGWTAGYTHAMNNISFSYNTVYNSSVAGIRLNNGQAQNVVVVNNIFWVDSANSGSIPIQLAGGNLSETIIDHNLLNRIASGHPTGTNYVVGDPKFVDVSKFNFHLGSTSPAIKKGIATTVLTDFDGNVRNFADIGAFRY